MVKTLVQKILSGGLVDGCAPAIHEVRLLAQYSTPVWEGEIDSGKDVARQLSDGLVLHQPGIDFNERMQYAIQFAVVKDAWLFWHFLGKAQLDQACVEAEFLNTSGITLLTHCAESLNEHDCEVNSKRLDRREANDLQHKCECSFDEGYLKLVRQALELGDLQRSFSRGKSLLRLVMKSAAVKRRVGARTVDAVLNAVNAHVRLWLKILYCAGIDLDQYGQQEYEFLKLNADNEFAVKSQRTGTLRRARLTSFQWGKTLDDWKFWWSTSMDEINNTFLLNYVASSDNNARTQESNLLVPGAWFDTQEEQPNKLYDNEIKRRALSRRRRKRYVTAAGFNMRDAREVFGRCDFHGWRYRPKVPREDCLAHCSEYWDCRWLL